MLLQVINIAICLNWLLHHFLIILEMVKLNMLLILILLHCLMQVKLLVVNRLVIRLLTLLVLMLQVLTDNRVFVCRLILFNHGFLFWNTEILLLFQTKIDQLLSWRQQGLFILLRVVLQIRHDIILLILLVKWHHLLLFRLFAL